MSANKTGQKSDTGLELTSSVALEPVPRTRAIHPDSRLNGKNWAKEVIDEHGGDLQKTLFAVLADHRGPKTMQDGLRTLVDHSPAFRGYLGIGSPQSLDSGNRSTAAKQTASVKQLAAAPLLLAQVATLDINEPYADHALAQLESLLQEPWSANIAFREAVADGFVCLARHLGTMPALLAERAVNLIVKQTEHLPEPDCSRVRATCASLSEGPSEPVARAREFGRQPAADSAAASSSAHASSDFSALNPYLKIVVNEALRRGIRVEVINADQGRIALHHAGFKHYCRGSLTRLTSEKARTLCADKMLTGQRLRELDLPVPRQHIARDPASNAAFLRQCGSVVVKPTMGWQGKGISVDVRTEEELKTAIDCAADEVAAIKRTRGAQMGGNVMIEEFCPGEDLRVVVIDYEVVAAAVRRPAMVVGDGSSTVAELIERRNAERADATEGVSQIPMDAETERCLANAGLAYDTVLAEGMTATVRKNSNVHTGGTIHDVTAELSPTLREVAETAARGLEIPVVGFDFQISSSDKEKYVIIEANERVGLANHEPQPVAQRFIDLLFPFTAEPA